HAVAVPCMAVPAAQPRPCTAGLRATVATARAPQSRPRATRGAVRLSRAGHAGAARPGPGGGRGALAVHKPALRSGASRSAADGIAAQPPEISGEPVESLKWRRNYLKQYPLKN